MANMEQGHGEVCSLCMDSNDFRTLSCGHTFCIICLQILHEHHGGELPCPIDRKIEQTEPTRLPTPVEFTGQKFSSTIFDENFVDINHVLDAQVRQRRTTIDSVRLVANTMKNQEMKCAGAKVGGSVTAVVGSVMAIVGLSLSLTGFGAIAGIPLGITGASLAAAGGVTTGVTFAVESWLKKIGIRSIQEDLNKDYFRAEQIRVLLGRSAADPEFADKWKIDPMLAAYIASILPRLTKVGVTTAAGVRAAIGITAGVGRAAATTGLHVAGIIFAAVLIPIDLTQMIISSIKLHKNKPSAVINDMFEKAEQLEIELKLFLLNGNHFHLIHCKDAYANRWWVYVAVSAVNMKRFLDSLKKNYRFTYAQVTQLGEIIEKGEGASVPNEIQKTIQTNWYDLHTAYLATATEQLQIE